MSDFERHGPLIRQLQGALEGNKVVRGTVDAQSGTPSITAGTGFSVTDNGVGDYTINFSPAFSDVPTVVAVVGRAAAAAFVRVHSSQAVTASAARFITFTTAFAVADCEFHFIAVGPA